jgi:predicted DCC family thiol-disulfide oxidoreductase YuxK
MKPLIFYDRDCGFCDRTVQWVAARDRDVFDFAPLGGATFLRAVEEDVRRSLPDTIVVVTSAGDVLIRSTAARYVLKTVGGIWSAVGAALAVVPKPLADAGYNLFARHRHRFAREACELPSPALRKRLLP